MGFFDFISSVGDTVVDTVSNVGGFIGDSLSDIGGFFTAEENQGLLGDLAKFGASGLGTYYQMLQGENAADAQLQAAQGAQNLLAAQYATTRQMYDPWYKAGLAALPELQQRVMGGPGDYTQSPGYQWQLDQGIEAMNRQAAARGGVNSGRAMKEAMRYGQGLASQDYDNFLARYYNSLRPLQSLAGVGQTAVNQVSGLGANYAANAGNMQNLAGMARASAYTNQANAVNQGLQNLFSGFAPTPTINIGG